MKRIIFLLLFVVAMAVWCTPSFATTYNSIDATPGAGVTDAIIFNNGGALHTLTITDGKDIFNAIPGNQASPGVATDSTLSAVSTDNSSLSDIKFNGNSTVYGKIGATAPFFNEIRGGTADTTVNFLGDVYTTRFVFTADSTVTLAAGKTVTNGAITTTGGANTGTLVLNSGSNWGGTSTAAVTGIKKVSILGGTNTAGVSAIITGAVAARQFSLLTNTLNMTGGALTINSGGIIDTTLGGTATSAYGHISVSGAANIIDTVALNVTVPAGTYIPLGTLFDIVNATGAITANIVPTITDVGVTNPLYTFAVEPITGTAAGKLTIKTTGTPIQPANPVADPVADVAAAALATLPVTSPIVLAINNLTNPGAVAAAEAQLAPSTASLASPLLTYQGVRQFQALWLDRLDGCGQVSWPSENKENCKGSTADNGWWLKGFGYFGNQASRSGFTEYDAKILGSMIAYDRSLGLNTRAGLGVGYARTTIKGKVYDANTDSDTYRAVAYIGHERGPWFFDGSGSFGWNEYRDRRHVEFSGVDTTAKSKYSGQDYTAFGRAGFHLPALMKFIISPMASLQYTRINIDGHTEKEAGSDVNMVVKSQHYDYLESGLGAKVERNFSFRNLTLVPEGHFEWLHKLSNPRIKQVAAYEVGSAAFTTPSLRTVADSYHAGVGLNLLSCACSATIWSLEGGYDYYWRTDGYAANQVSMRFSRRF